MFHYDTTRVDPAKVAQTDDVEFNTVSKLPTTLGGFHKRTTLEFLVRWKDYGEANNLWLPYQELRQNIKLHEYLRERGLHKLIPSKEKDESQAGNEQARATRKR